MYLYQRSHRFFAQVADDIKAIAEKELQSLGAKSTAQVYRGIHFNANAEVLYTINFQSRLVHRILAPLITFDCHSDAYLYKTASQIKWRDFLDPANTLAVFATVSHSNITHSKFAALRLKDAIVDYFRDRTGRRPSIDTQNPDIWINLHIQNNQATISLDASGGSLHRRGYRKKTVEAPMIETLAAAIISYSDWHGRTPLYDPFCGSGALLCEAYLLATQTPAAILRKRFGFERLPDFNAAIWRQVKNQAMKQVKSLPRAIIAGSDKSAQAVQAALRNCGMIDKNHSIQISQRDVFDIENLQGHTIVCNPPYGIRMAKGKNLDEFYKKFGDFLKQRCRNATAYIYFGEPAYIKSLGLKPAWKKPLSTGGLDGRLAKYEVY